LTNRATFGRSFGEIESKVFGSASCKIVSISWTRFSDFSSGIELFKIQLELLRIVSLKDVVGSHALLMQSLFDGDILRRFSARFASETDFCFFAILMAAQNETSISDILTYP
jgi:hypothetical protein